MENRYLFNTFFLLVLFILFFWQALSATLKYLEKTTIESTIKKYDDSILFPSITVCQKYFMGLHETEIYNASMSIEDKVDILHTNIWKRNEVFHYFSHPNMFNMSYPCTTLDGSGTSPGKPCTFPAIEFDKVILTCEYYCYTRYILTN